jgi:hypothetical protein
LLIDSLFYASQGNPNPVYYVAVLFRAVPHSSTLVQHARRLPVLTARTQELEEAVRVRDAEISALRSRLAVAGVAM